MLKLMGVLSILGVLMMSVDAHSEVLESESLSNTDNFYTESIDSEADRFESFNRTMFRLNDRMDKYIAKPIAKGYQFVTPKIVDTAVTNFFNNLDELETFANSIFQAKLHNTIVSLNRFIYNSIFGIFGLIDVATPMGLQSSEEDFGQTLAYWGHTDSTYLFLPVFGPTTARDFGGTFVDAYANPLMYADGLTSMEKAAISGLELVDKRADLLAAENLLFEEDRYLFIRNAYLQNRQYLINDGKVEDPFADEDIDYDDF